MYNQCSHLCYNGKKHFEVVEMFADAHGGEVYTASSDGEERQPLLFNAVTNSLQRANSDDGTDKPTEYCWRWYMLAVVAVLNLSNGMVSYCFLCYSILLCIWSCSWIMITVNSEHHSITVQ